MWQWGVTKDPNLDDVIDVRPLAYQNKEECDNQSHSSGHDLRLDQVRDPGDDDEHEAGKVDLNENLHCFALKLNLKKWIHKTLL